MVGRNCVYPKTINGETISCKVEPPKSNDLVKSLVHVTYAPLRLTSAQTFQFVYPELTSLSPACDPVSSRTLLHNTGGSLHDAVTTATVSVGPANVPCELIAIGIREPNNVLDRIVGRVSSGCRHHLVQQVTEEPPFHGPSLRCSSYTRTTQC